MGILSSGRQSGKVARTLQAAPALRKVARMILASM
jgi:hypothetical protein